MDVLQAIRNNLRETKECEARSKMISGLSERKYALQKKLREEAVKLSEREASLRELRKEVCGLRNLYAMLEEQEKVALEMVQDLMKHLVIQEEATEKSQAIYWKKINDFVSKSVHHCKKRAAVRKKTTADSVAVEVEKRKGALRQCDLEGRLEAMKLFEGYQHRRIDYFLEVKSMLDS